MSKQLNPEAMFGVLIAGLITLLYNVLISPISNLELIVFFGVVFYTLGQIMPYSRK